MVRHAHLRDGRRLETDRAAQGSRIDVPWPLMPGRPVEKRDELGKALGKTPLETLDAPFGFVAVYEARRPFSRSIRIWRRSQSSIVARSSSPRAAITSDFVLRVFAPKLGLPEDPVCGTAHRISCPIGRRSLDAASCTASSCRRAAAICGAHSTMTASRSAASAVTFFPAPSTCRSHDAFFRAAVRVGAG